MDLVTRAQQIKNETEKKANTANRVGGLFEDIAAILEANGENLVLVNTVADFEIESNTVRLQEGKTYLVTTHLDLEGKNILAQGVCNLIGFSSETCSITSTGLNTPLITSGYTIVLESITIKDVNVALSIFGNIRTVALDWRNVNFENVANVGTINTCDNLILDTCSFLGSDNLQLTGTIGTVAFNNSLFRGLGNDAPIIRVTNTATITRRFRMNYSSVISLDDNKGIEVDNDASIPTEGFILDTVNFSGNGTYLGGVQDDDNRSLFIRCNGIPNSDSIGNMYMKNNAVATTITTQGERYNISGTTEVNGINRRFNHDAANNALQYVGALTRQFHVISTFTIAPESNNQKYGIYIGVNKGGPIDPTADRISESEAYINTSQAGRADAASIQSILTLEPNDRVYMIVQNVTGTADVTMEFLNMVIK
jgi:hypothetical protein